ncbi:MAG: hypothetical protein KDB60_02845 [Propionibacteriaceae bacterium]|nr:hypothetical protein [Propionibacteriaceae bacterium]
MKAVTIRGVPDEVVAELAGRAARGGRSLQEYLLAELVELSSRPDISSWVADVRGRKQAAGVEVDVSAILAARDADRR